MVVVVENDVPLLMSSLCPGQLAHGPGETQGPLTIDSRQLPKLDPSQGCWRALLNGEDISSDYCSVTQRIMNNKYPTLALSFVDVTRPQL